VTIASKGFIQILRKEVEEIRGSDFVVIKAGNYPPNTDIENVLEILNIGTISHVSEKTITAIAVEKTSKPIKRRPGVVRRRRVSI